MGILRTTIEGTQDGQTIQTVMGWIIPTTTTAAQADLLAQNVGNNWRDYVCGELVDDYAVSGVTAVGVDDPTVGVFHANAFTGSSTNGPLPEFVVGNVQLVTGRRGRSYAGRFGLPGLTINDVDPLNANHIYSVRQGVLQTALTDFWGHMASSLGTPTLAVISTISGGTPRLVPIATPVADVVLHQPFGSRVSRKG